MKSHNKILIVSFICLAFGYAIFSMFRRGRPAAVSLERATVTRDNVGRIPIKLFEDPFAFDLPHVDLLEFEGSWLIFNRKYEIEESALRQAQEDREEGELQMPFGEELSGEGLFVADKESSQFFKFNVHDWASYKFKDDYRSNFDNFVRILAYMDVDKNLVGRDLFDKLELKSSREQDFDEMYYEFLNTYLRDQYKTKLDEITYLERASKEDNLTKYDLGKIFSNDELKRLRDEVVKGLAHRFKLHFQVKPEYLVSFFNDFVEFIKNEDICKYIYSFKVAKKLSPGEHIRTLGDEIPAAPVPVMVVYIALLCICCFFVLYRDYGVLVCCVQSFCQR